MTLLTNKHQTKNYLIVFLIIYLCSLQQIFAQPTRDWATYFANNLTLVSNVVYDKTNECIYVAGITADSTELATPGSHKDSFGDIAPPLGPIFLLPLWKTDAFLSKFDLDGNRIWSTYIGGVHKEQRITIEKDNTGNIYVSGTTQSATGIATVGSFMATKTDTTKIMFLMKFDESGNQLWGTYYGDMASDNHQKVVKIAFDNDNNIYLASAINTNVPGLATAGAFQATNAGQEDGLLSKFDSNGTRIWTTYYGGTSIDVLTTVYYSNDGYLYIAGNTEYSNNLGTSSTYYPILSTIDSFAYQGFITKFTTSGSRIWGTYLPGISPIGINGDNSGNIYISGLTKSDTGVATSGTHQTIRGSSGHIDDMVLLKFNNYGQRIWGTYYGGNGMDYNNEYPGTGVVYTNSLEFDTVGNSIYFSGITTSTNNIATDCGYECTTPNRKGFIASFDTSGQLNWGSYYDEQIADIAINREENKNGGQDGDIVSIYIVGQTKISGLTTPGSHKEIFTTGYNGAGYIAKFLDYYQCPNTTLNISLIDSILTADTGYVTYEWNHNGTITTSTSNEYSIVGSAGGFVIVTATNSCGCSYVADSFDLGPTAIKNPNYNSSLYLYPNPASNSINIDIQSIPSIKDIKLEIYNIVGKKVNANYNITTHQITIDVRDYPNGIYYIKLTNGDKQYNGKFVVVGL